MRADRTNEDREEAMEARLFVKLMLLKGTDDGGGDRHTACTRDVELLNAGSCFDFGLVGFGCGLSVAVIFLLQLFKSISHSPTLPRWLPFNHVVRVFAEYKYDEDLGFKDVNGVPRDGNCVATLRDTLARLSVAENTVVQSIQGKECDSLPGDFPDDLQDIMRSRRGSPAPRLVVVHNGMPGFFGQY
ncbi:hypothetical protein FBULB1_6969 [Fusarium bulbicola]|nr:hypothetical protein FBULB1_6969 [Fusarium bulbicola]